MADRRKKKKTKKNKNSQTLDRILIFIMLFFALSLVAIISDKTGLVGNYLGDLYFYLFGLGAYIFPILGILTSVFLMKKEGDKRKIYSQIWIYILFFCLLLFLDMRMVAGMNNPDHFKMARNLSNIRMGPGLLGAFLGFFLYPIIGSVGSYILIFSLVLASILFFLDLGLLEFLQELRDFVKNLTDNISDSIRLISEKINELSGKKEEKKVEKNPKKEAEKILEKNDEGVKEEGQAIKINSYNAKENFGPGEQMELDIDMRGEGKPYKRPPASLLKPSPPKTDFDKKGIKNQAKIIEDTMASFGIEVETVEINRGPRITSFELKPQQGVKLSKIVSLSDNLSLNLASPDIRIEAPIAGKPYVGVEVPNKESDTVCLKDIIFSENFMESKAQIPFALGKSTEGEPVVSAIEKMPHLLIAGATGSGKSVCINSIIISILYRFSPDEVKLILIDPKVVELSVYNGIPHLAVPVVTDPKKAASSLNWAVKEMERRYQVFSENSVRDIRSYRKKRENNPEMEDLPYIVIIIDELSDLMMAASQKVEDHIIRLAQMARACGIHLIIATQRPTVDVITGTIKANIPSRIAFAVSSAVDSRTIIDMSGAEKLLGKGDMLYYPSNYMKPKRIQGAYISDKEVEDVVTYLRSENEADYNEEIIKEIEEKDQGDQVLEDEDMDELIDEAKEIVISEGQASVSLIQRKLRVGHARAGRIIDQLERLNVVGPYEGSKPRQVLIKREDEEGGGGI